MASAYNYALVKSQLKCDCEPYTQVKTYKAWKAEGKQVARGSKGIDTITYLDYQDEETGEDKTRPWHAYVFCECQLVK